ncbi:DUF2218 domain-containing protein [Nisaea denitrificans]|uniref:DUF2218 domain-containing protein n=1 Tax=Nisaea denitrificans TaxID=390877 RepID=UPI0003FF6C28|nr:DUF2218 domain-containing protein [Nisaea denitrificans]
MPSAHATVRSEKAGRYLVQLCKHFAHKIPATWEETDGKDTTGHADFGIGTCDMTARDGALLLACNAPDEDGLGKVKYVLEDHIVRFGWKEELKVDWQDGAPAGA